MDIYMNGIIRTPQIKTVVVDEADRLMDMGFMPQLRSILEVVPEKHQTLLFSATFSTTIAELAAEFLAPEPVRIETGNPTTPVELVTQLRYDLPNIQTKINLLKLLLTDKEEFRRVMIFTETKKNADRIVERLGDHWKGELSVLHSNKAQNSRLNALKAFKEGKTRIMFLQMLRHVESMCRMSAMSSISIYLLFLRSISTHRTYCPCRKGRNGYQLRDRKRRAEIRRNRKADRQQVEWAALPENLVISDVLLDDEKVQTSNIVYQKGKPKGGGAFHAKSAKNSKTPQKVRKDRTKEGSGKSRKG